MQNKYEGRTYEEALQKCLRTLELDETELYIDVKELEPSEDNKNKVEITVLPKSEVIEYIKEIVQNIGNALVSKITTKVSDTYDVLNVSIYSDVNPILIGKDGKNLSAIQTIIKQSIFKKFNRNVKVTVDIANYKNKKIRNLKYEVSKIAKEVLNSKVEAHLDPMNSYERRIVHTLVSEFNNLETISEGEEPNRYVVIKYKENTY
ncbi:MAG: KH domain-containing protein [Firmicutes bacterium]|jgi:spoIIIJ-associated protein|nr:KH domain-containing protein [Bacillota bacterium]